MQKIFSLQDAESTKVVKATITSRATVDSTGHDLPELMHCDTPRQLIGEIHTQMVGL